MVGGYRKGIRNVIISSWCFTHSQGFGETFFSWWLIHPVYKYKIHPPIQ